MDDTLIQSLEKRFYEKIILYNDLLHSLKKEREALINIDLDELWRISKRKEEICAKIDSLRLEIISTINPKMAQRPFDLNRILDLIPWENRSKFQKLHGTLVKLKMEVEVLRKENMIFIEDSLRFLDEMISIIVGETQSKTMYDEKCHLSKSGHNLLLSSEA